MKTTVFGNICVEYDKMGYFNDMPDLVSTTRSGWVRLRRYDRTFKCDSSSIRASILCISGTPKRGPAYTRRMTRNLAHHYFFTTYQRHMVSYILVMTGSVNVVLPAYAINIARTNTTDHWHIKSIPPKLKVQWIRKGIWPGNGTGNNDSQTFHTRILFHYSDIIMGAMAS